MEQSYLYVLLAAALLVIAGLVCVVLYYRHRLYRCQRAMVRCISENLDMKSKLPPGERPHLFTAREVSSKEFTKIICNMLNRLTLVSAFFLLMASPAMAGDDADTVYMFRFVPARDMFLVPFGDNGPELERLEREVARYRQRITDGEIPLRVEGHADSHAKAKTRANRVKSELITRQGLREDCFVTRNRADGQHYVTVTLRVPSSTPAPEGDGSDSPSPDGWDDAATALDKDNDASAKADSSLYDNAARPVEVLPREGATASAKDYTLALRVNLLRWATLTPDLGLEWRVSPAWAILVRGSWTSWSWNDKARRYALWEVAPEARWYLGAKRRGYLGAMYKAGQFNYKFSTLGRQGDLMGGGLTGGYRFRLNDALSLDLHAAVGYLRVEYDRYEVTRGVRVARGRGARNWWGPIDAGVSLVWRLF